MAGNDAASASPAQIAANAAQYNAALRSNLVKNSVEMIQQIYSTTVSGTPIGQTVFNIQPRFVGLIKGFWINLTATITQGASGQAIVPSIFGAPALLQQVVFTDLNNYTRHQTNGIHLACINSMKRRQPLAAVLTAAATDNIYGYGNNFTPGTEFQTASIAASTTGTINCWFYLPLAYGDDDLRGAVYANVVNATANLQLTINPNVVAGLNPATSDQLNAPYVFSAAGTVLPTITSLMVKVYQQFLDQIPIFQQGNMIGRPMLPPNDIATFYELKNTTVTGIVATQDFSIPYSNFRSFLSTMFIYDQNGTFNAGTDLNYVALQAANALQVIKVDPFLLTVLSRNELMMDLPKGTYYVSHRKKPINTLQYGNFQLVLNASSASASSSVQVGYEDFALQNVVLGAGSLASG